VEAKVRVERGRGALHQLQLVMAGMLRGGQGTALQALRRGMAEARRARDLQGAGLQGLRAVLTRLRRGEVAMRVMLWRRHQARAAWEEAEAQQAQAEGEARARRLDTGRQQLRLAVGRMLHRAQGEVVAALREGLRAHTARVVAHVQLRGLAAREMRACLVRVTRGELAMRLERWQQGWRQGDLESALQLRDQVQAAKNYEERVHKARHTQRQREDVARRQAAAMRQLHWILTRLLHGVRAAALLAMRENQAQQSRAQAWMDEVTSRDRQARGVAMREIRAAMARLAKGAIAMHIGEWRSNQVGEESAAARELNGEQDRYITSLERRAMGAAAHQVKALYYRLCKSCTQAGLYNWRVNNHDSQRYDAEWSKERLHAELERSQLLFRAFEATWF
jgi:hypothetical protein